MPLEKLINILKYISRNYRGSKLLDSKEIIKRNSLCAGEKLQGETCKKSQDSSKWTMWFMKM